MNNRKPFDVKQGSSFYVWHCKSQGKDDFCKFVGRCRGTSCEMYDKWNDDNCAIDDEFIKLRKEEGNVNG